MRRIPLLGLSDPAAPIAWRNGAPITAGELMGDARWLAERLPACGFQINLCEDRYHFLTALLSAMLRGQALLLPPGRARGDLLPLRRRHPSVYCLTDTVADYGDMELMRFSGAPGNLNNRPEELSAAGDLVAAELYTSGSTGTATVHMKSWEMLLQGAQLTGTRLGLDRLRGGSVVATVPPQHMYGLEMSIFLPLYWGLAVSAQRPLFAADIAAAFEGMPQPRILITTPLQLRNCIVENAELPPLELVLSATAPLSRVLARQAEQRFRTRVMDVYGSTETGAVASRRTADDGSWSPLPGVSIERRGRRWWLTAGHLPEAIPLNDDIRLQPDGRFELLGRDADLIKIAGKRASLADLNRKLLGIDGVEDGVFFLPDNDSGATARLICFVRAPGVAEEAITAALRQLLDPAFLPRPLFRVAELPRNDTGKLSRQALLRLFAACSREPLSEP